MGFSTQSQYIIIKSISDDILSGNHRWLVRNSKGELFIATKRDRDFKYRINRVLGNQWIDNVKSNQLHYKPRKQ